MASTVRQAADDLIEQADSHDALRRVRAADLDLVVFSHRPVPDPANHEDGRCWSALGDDPFRLILPPQHRLARTRRIDVAHRANERFCAPPGGNLAYLPRNARRLLRTR